MLVTDWMIVLAFGLFAVHVATGILVAVLVWTWRQDWYEESMGLSVRIDRLAKEQRDSMGVLKEMNWNVMGVHKAFVTHAARVDEANKRNLELAERLTPKLQNVPPPTRPTSYDELDDNAPVTWAQIKAAAEAKRQAAAQAQPETQSKLTQDVEETDEHPMTAFDQILKRAQAQEQTNE